MEKEIIEDVIWWYGKGKQKTYTNRVSKLIKRDPLAQDFKENKEQIEKKWDVSLTLIIKDNSSPNYLGKLYESSFGQEQFLTESLKEAVIEVILNGKRAEDKLYLQFDLNLLNKTTNTEKFVKEIVWEAVKRRLDKKSKAIRNEIYGIRREDTFKKYLEWYDLHIKEKLGFRVLALYEKQKDKSAFLEKARCKKIKWGDPVKGEDKIEKAVKLIYKAIHRDDYSRKKIEPLIEKYNCPTHENDCPLSCGYFKKWQSRFNRLNPI